jgi:hypothetical protein
MAFGPLGCQGGRADFGSTDNCDLFFLLMRQKWNKQVSRSKKKNDMDGKMVEKKVADREDLSCCPRNIHSPGLK